MMTSRKSVLITCLSLAIILWGSMSIAAGTLEGFVDNPSGEAIGGAQIIGSNGSSTFTGQDGLYSLGIEKGVYSFTASADGYVSRTVDNITISDNATTKLNFTLSQMVVESAYPSLGILGVPLPVEINGGGFDDNTRLALLPDSGNSFNVTGQYLPDILFEARAVELVGTTAYVVDLITDHDNNTGTPETGVLYIVDVSNPTEPAELSRIAFAGYGRDIAVRGSYAYITHGDEGTGNGGLVVIDISNPETPEIVDSSITMNVAYGIAIEESWAYVVDGIPGGSPEGNIHAISLSIPESPSLEWSQALTVNGHAYCALGLDVQGNRAYVANEWGGLHIIDIEEGSSTKGDTLNTPDEYFADMRGVKVVNNWAYVAAEWDGLLVYDVSNSNNVILAGKADTLGFARNVDVIGDIAYVADLMGGLVIFDVSNNNMPEMLGSVDTEGYSWDVVVEGNFAYMADATEGLNILDISRPEKQTLAGYLSSLSGTSDVILEGNVIYITSEDGLHVIDVSDRSTPSLTQTIAHAGIGQRMVKIGDIVYIAAYDGDLQIVDLAATPEPTVTSVVFDNDNGSTALPNYSWAVDVDRNIDLPNYIYVADGDCEGGTTGGLNLINIDVLTNPLVHDRIELGGCASDVVVINKKAFVSVYDVTGENNGLKIIDVDPDSPDYKSVYSTDYGGYTPVGSNGLAVVNDYAYVADSWEGLQIINVNNTKAPFHVGGSGQFGNEAKDVKVAGTSAYVATDDFGVYLIDVSVPENPVIVGWVDTPGQAAGLDVDTDYGYVADSYAGLTIVQLPYEFTANIDSIDAGGKTIHVTSLASPQVGGHYRIRAFHQTKDIDSILEGAVTFTETPDLMTSKAIVVAGGGNYTGNLIWPETKAYANQAYDNLIYQGYQHADITYITDEPNALARYGAAAAGANLLSATKENLKNAITSWAKSGQNPGDLLLFMEDHGISEEFLMRGNVNPDLAEYVTAQELDSWLDTLQNETSNKVIVVYDACRSGSFISRLIPPLEKTRLVMTSSTPGEPAYFLSINHSFSSHFWSTFTGVAGTTVKLSSAFERGSSLMSAYQSARMDANGNGVPNEGDDFAALASYEATIGAVRRSYSAPSRSRPVITTVSPDQQAIGNSATLSVSGVYDVDGDIITRVWAEIYGPNFNPDPLQTVQNIPSVQLTGPDVNGVYQVPNHPVFGTNGTYIITYYAEDGAGIYSLPKTSLVTQQNGTALPDLPDLYEDDNGKDDDGDGEYEDNDSDDTPAQAKVITLNSPTPQEHSFHVTGDGDWVVFYGIGGEFYNIKASNPTGISDPVIDIFSSRDLGNPVMSSDIAGLGEEEAIIGWNPELPFGQGKLPDGVGELYYVRITNSTIHADAHYGANVRYKLQIYTPIAPTHPGMVAGRIISGGVGVGGAIIRVGSATAITASDGTFILHLMPGSYFVSVSCSGYQSFSFPVTVASGDVVSYPGVDMNSIPRIINSPPTTVEANKEYSFTPVVIDIDGDPLNYAITGKPSWASFSTTTGKFWGTPGGSDVGSHGPIRISVTDTAGAGDSIEFTVVVGKNSVGSLPSIYMLLLRPETVP